jgi:hypothetical protein
MLLLGGLLFRRLLARESLRFRLLTAQEFGYAETDFQGAFSRRMAERLIVKGARYRNEFRTALPRNPNREASFSSLFGNRKAPSGRIR